MEKVILICDECGCEIENNTYTTVYNLNGVVISERVSATRTEQVNIDTYSRLHFCSKDCIEQFFHNLARGIWNAKYPITCLYTKGLCDYKGPDGKGYCEGCAREYSGTRRVPL
jgi:hypothetical protein